MVYLIRLQLLADDLGVQTNAIFNWYVEQVRYNSWIIVYELVVLFLVSTIVSYGAYRRWRSTDGAAPAIISIGFTIVAIVVLIHSVFNFSQLYTSIADPEYHAVHMLLNDLSPCR